MSDSDPIDQSNDVRAMDALQAAIWARCVTELKKEGVNLTIGQSYGVGMVIKEVLHPKVTALISAKEQECERRVIEARIDELGHVDRHSTWYPNGSEPIEAQGRIATLKAELAQLKDGDAS